MFCYNFFLGGCCVNMDVFFTQEITCKNTCFFCFVFVFVFFLSWFSFTDIDDSQDSRRREGGDHLLFHSTTSTRSRTFRYLFATLHVRWLSHIFNHTASIYQTTYYSMWFTTLSNYHLIDWWREVSHPCITSEPTNQMC